jgi:hypothetical protein
MKPERCYSLLLTFLLLLLLPGGAKAAVEFLAGVDRDSVTVGDAITLRLRARWDAGDRVAMPRPDTALAGGPFEVLEQQPPARRSTADGRTEERLDVRIAAYRPGVLEVPAMVLRYRTAEGDTGRVASRAIPVTVHSVLPEGQTDIRDIKPPVALPARVPLWVWLATAGLIGAGGLLFWYLRRRARRPVETPPPAPVDWPAEVARVLALGLLEKGAFQEYYFRLSEVLRRYLEDRTGVEAMERTTTEVLHDLAGTPLDASQAAEVEGFLTGADLVKFAKHRPSAKSAADAADQIRNLMRRIDLRLYRPAGTSTPATGGTSARPAPSSPGAGQPEAAAGDSRPIASP